MHRLSERASAVDRLPKVQQMRAQHDAQRKSHLTSRLFAKVRCTAGLCDFKESEVDIIFIVSVWWLTGVLLCFYTAWSISTAFSVGDLIMVVIGGMFGPLALGWVIIYGNCRWLKKRIF